MAARTEKIRQTAETRAKIRTSQLINRLTKHALGKLELTATQVKAIEVLLKKTLPDLSSLDATMDGEVVNYVISAQPMTEDDWEATYSLGAPSGATESTH